MKWRKVLCSAVFITQDCNCVSSSIGCLKMGCSSSLILFVTTFFVFVNGVAWSTSQISAHLRRLVFWIVTFFGFACFIWWRWWQIRSIERFGFMLILGALGSHLLPVLVFSGVTQGRSVELRFVFLMMGSSVEPPGDTFTIISGSSSSVWSTGEIQFSSLDLCLVMSMFIFVFLTSSWKNVLIVCRHYSCFVVQLGVAVGVTVVVRVKNVSLGCVPVYEGSPGRVVQFGVLNVPSGFLTLSIILLLYVMNCLMGHLRCEDLVLFLASWWVVPSFVAVGAEVRMWIGLL